MLLGDEIGSDSGREIFRQGQFDVIINRTLVHVPLTAIVAGIFAAIALSQKALIALTGQSSLV